MASKREPIQKNPKSRKLATPSRKAAPASGEVLAGKVAVVTGASRGIGRAIAEALAGAGCAVVVTSRCASGARSVALALTAAGGRAMSVATDVRDPKSVDKLFSVVRAEFGRLDFLVNNAGIAHEIINVQELPLEAWQDVIATNLTGMFLCTRAALPLMSSGGVIVNNLSIAATTAFAGFAAYDASKHGALGFTNTLREELRDQGIRVLALIPGATATDIWEQFMPEADREKMLAPQAIASVVVHAISLPADAPVEEIRMMPLSGTTRT
jgi:3-oxoacyl-[acyl-carrier protein] reductase